MFLHPPAGRPYAIALVAALLSVLCARAQPAPGICRAPIESTPCGAQSALAPPAEPDLDSALANPVHLVSGAKYLHETDLPRATGHDRPSFIRTYRLAQSGSGVLGAHWAHEYDVRLVRQASGWQIRLADGGRIAFDTQGTAIRPGAGHIRAWPLPAKPGARTQDDAVSKAQHNEPANVWRRDDGSRLEFDAGGRLLTIRPVGLPPTLIERHPEGPLAGHIERIRQGAGTLTLHYDDRSRQPLLQALDTPLGRFHYHYDAEGTPPRLVRVERPDGMSRHYHHEPRDQGGHRGAITGVSLASRGGALWRARSWAYDTQGRVIRATPGPPPDTAVAASTITFSYAREADGRSGSTQARNAHHFVDLRHEIRAGRAVITGVRSACATCSAIDHPLQRDAFGRLTAIGSLVIERDAQGRIRQLAESGGWPGLRLDYDVSGRRTGWASALTGYTRLLQGDGGRLLGLRHANGDTLDLGHDAAGRPTLLHHARAGQPAVSVRLRWQGPRLQRISHPAEDEQRRHDANGRLLERRVRRAHPAGALQYRETFAYDARGRLLRHGLPEGGALHYDWGEGPRLTRLVWESADGRRHVVLAHAAGQAGYRYGNGLHLQTGPTAGGRAVALILTDGVRPLWAEQRTLDTAGRVQALQQPQQAVQYRYDSRDRLTVASARPIAGADSAAAAPDWFAWADDGHLIARRSQTIDAISRDASGLPLSAGNRRLQYDVQRLLASVTLSDGTIIRYTRNAQGHAIRREQDGRQTERYYLDNRLVGVWQRPPATPLRFGITQRYLYAHGVPVGLLQTGADGQTRLYYVHADLLGAPVLLTDGARRVRWRATYDALGRATAQGNPALPLRLPGQDEDPATGWHDNVFRTYLPEVGHYLEPDPLGPLPGHQALGYAAQQPMRHADPLGLILLAFDGTRYDQANAGNVWKLTQTYDGPRFYHAGPGSNLILTWDAVTAASSGQILRTQWQSLIGALQAAQGAPRPTAIDLLGFSRGAALARDFANRIARQTRNGWFSYDDPLRGNVGLCVNLRFLGLFDTVAQFGVLGSANAGYDLAISDAWQWVAHAVALHEFRSLFPLVSASTGAPANVAEAPFIGAHADIGGGMALATDGTPEASGDLSDVALNWMRWQALAALVPFKSLPDADQQVTQPLLHDERPPTERILENSDRALQDAATHSLGLQRFDPNLGAAQRAAFEAFIRRADLWQAAPGNEVGSVDMAAYGAWLQDRLGLPALAGPARQP